MHTPDKTQAVSGPKQTMSRAYHVVHTSFGIVDFFDRGGGAGFGPASCRVDR